MKVKDNKEGKAIYSKRLFSLTLITTILVILSVAMSISLVYASQFISNSQADFDEGTYYQTFYNTSGFVQLNATYTTGNYTSEIFNAGASTQWNNISWWRGYGFELSDYKAEENYIVNPANMTGNVLLIHMNDYGTNIEDTSGEGNNGTYNGVLNNQSGKFNSAIGFDGVNDYVNIPDIPILEATNGTISLWFNPSNNYSSSNADEAYFISKGNSYIGIGISDGSGYYTSAPAGTIFFHQYSGEGYIVNSNQNIWNKGTWYHVVGTWDDDGMKLYIDDSKVDNNSHTGDWQNVDDAWSIGAANGEIHNYNGTIDELAIYNRSLSPTEILDHYKRGALKLNLTVRSCDDASCSGESFTDINDTSPQDLSVTDNQYFQYRFGFETDSASYTPELYNVTVDFTTKVPCTCGDICVNQTGWWRGGGTFNSSSRPIQHAVDNATAGDTICVKDGLYNENVDMNLAHLTIQSENGSANCIVNALNSDDHVFNVIADYVNISGFTVTGATATYKAGINLEKTEGHCNYCNISDNIAMGNKIGIYVHSTSNYNTLMNNNVSNNQYGILVHYSDYNNLMNNIVNSNDNYGIFLQSSTHNNLTNNTVNSNKGSGDYGGIRVSGSNNNLTSNTINSNTNYGIKIYSGGNHNTLRKNNILNNRYGIYLDNASDNNISCNWVQNNTNAGFYLTSGSTGNTIENNNIIVNGVYNSTSEGYEYQFYNNQSNDVEAKNNWWGTNNDTIINASIYDWHDVSSKGNVTFLPKLEGSSPCAPVPELPTIILFSAGLLALAGYVWIREKKE